MTLNSSEQAEVRRHIDQLAVFLDLGWPTVIRDKALDNPAALSAMIAGLLLKSVQKLDQAASDVLADDYFDALEDLPAWTVREALRRWNRAQSVQLNPKLPHDFQWAPKPPILRKLAEHELARVQHRIRHLRRLCDAEPIVEYSEEHRKIMRRPLSREARAADDRGRRMTKYLGGQSLFPGALSAGSAIPGAIGMNRKGEKPEFLLVSEAVACLEAGMYENFNRPEPESVKEVKKHYPEASIGFGPQKGRCSEDHRQRHHERRIVGAGPVELDRGRGTRRPASSSAGCSRENDKNAWWFARPRYSSHAHLRERSNPTRIARRTARASRVTPAVTAAQAALSDTRATRDRECKGGVGKFCREREAAVAERRQLLDAATASVAQTADPQTEAAIRLVAWISRGLLRPAPEDFAMIRLILLALLPQIGGILMMVGRNSRER